MKYPVTAFENFNSRPRKEVDDGTDCTLNDYKIFQLTTSQGGRRLQ